MTVGLFGVTVVVMSENVRKLVGVVAMAALVVVGVVVLRIPHIPIGNSFGKVAVECVAGLCERAFDLREPTDPGGWGPEGLTREEVFFLLRYTDDVIILSKMLSLTCLAGLVGTVYVCASGRRIRFGVQFAGQRGDWLDLRLRVALLGRLRWK